MGRTLEVTLKSRLSDKRIYSLCKDYFLKQNCKLIEEKPYTMLTFRGGSHFWTYALATIRWEKALKTFTISIGSNARERTVKIKYEVSWMVSIRSKDAAAGRELFNLSKLLKAKITNIYH